MTQTVAGCLPLPCDQCRTITGTVMSLQHIVIDQWQLLVLTCVILVEMTLTNTQTIIWHAGRNTLKELAKYYNFKPLHPTNFKSFKTLPTKIRQAHFIVINNSTIGKISRLWHMFRTRSGTNNLPKYYQWVLTYSFIVFKFKLVGVCS
jgi:hypothetical protein